MQDVNNTNISDDVNRGVLDSLVEPTTRPRFHEAVVRPRWLDQQRLANDIDDDDVDEDSGSCPLDPSRYREFQLVGSDQDDDGGDSALARVLSLLNPAAATTTTTPTTPTTTKGQQELPHDDDDDDDDRAATLQSLLSFLFRDASENLVLWLSRSRFLVCHGPAFHRVMYNDDSAPDVFTFWHSYWLERPPAFEAAVEVGEDRVHRFRLGGASPEKPGPSRSAGACARTSEEGEGGGRWPAVIAALLSRITGSSLFGCSFDVGRSLGCLESIVSIEPPAGGRTLHFNGATNVTDEAAGIIARRTHPDTDTILSLEHWGRGGVAEVADALKANQCPKHLTLMEAAEEGVVEVLAPALRATTAVKVLEVLLPETLQREAHRRSSLVLLDAVRDNASLRKLVVRQLDTVTGPFMKDFWSSVLASRTLRSVDASFLIRRPKPTARERREASLHVAELLKSNRVATDLRYEGQSHDVAVWNAEALPLLQLNRLRAAAPDLGPILSAVLASDPVRRHPMLTYQVLRSSAGALARRFLVPSSRSSSPSGDGRHVK